MISWNQQNAVFSNCPVEAGDTVDSLLSKIENAIFDGTLINATYDSELGYPRSVYIKYSSLEMMDGVSGYSPSIEFYIPIP